MASRQEGQPPGTRKASGRNIGLYVIDMEIGNGSFAQVYMGWHKVRSLSPPSRTAAVQGRLAMASLMSLPAPAHRSRFGLFWHCVLIVPRFCCRSPKLPSPSSRSNSPG